ncbi:MAG: glycoside hydrolase family 43 protein [Treponema sp.]|nr:glycoside hydrolase family 43 protein [Treponema sp.]
MQHYLFVHFKEKRTPDGEQVYFGLSKDGFHWEEVNGGQPVLWAFYGDRGVRDFTITRCKNNGKFYIIATDLSLAYGMRGKFHNSWAEVSRNGSKQLAIWESEDLVNWKEQRLFSPGNYGGEEFGCLWAPDVIYDSAHGDYILHWSSSYAGNNYGDKCIFYSRTADFEHFTAPEILYKKDGPVIDSAMYEEDGRYYLFVKSERAPSRILQLVSDTPTGPWERVTAFDESMLAIQEGLYEAPTAVKTEDGRWCLFLDFYGVKGAGQGYVPFVADSMASGAFVRSDASFAFPYGFKHGTILPITEEEYDRIRTFNHWDLF